MSVAIARKSGCLEIFAQHRYGEIENSNEVADFEAISARNRLSIAYFGFKIENTPTSFKGNNKLLRTIILIGHLLTQIA